MSGLEVGFRDTLRLSRRREEVAGRNDGSYARFSRRPQKRSLLNDSISISGQGFESGRKVLMKLMVMITRRSVVGKAVE